MAEQDDTNHESADARRVYYDHEPAYQAIAEAGGRGWDDLPGEQRPICDDSSEPDSYAALERFLASRWAPPAGTRALELGCGGGQASLMLAEHGYDVVGVDYSETAIELARENAEEAGAECEFIVADVLDLSEFDANDFGLVIDNHCLHCLVEPPDREALLSETTRVLHPGGTFFSETMTREGGFDPEMLDVDPETFISASGTRIWVSKIELDEELRAARFNVIHTYSRRQEEPGFGLTYVNYALAR